MIILTNAQKIDHSEIEYPLVKASIDQHKCSENLYIYANYCQLSVSVEDAITAMSMCLQHEETKSDQRCNYKTRIIEW